MGQASSTPFWTATKSAFAKFFVVEAPASDAKTAEVLRGAPAADHIMAEFVAAKTREAIIKFSCGELSKLTRFGWLATPQHKARLEHG